MERPLLFGNSFVQFKKIIRLSLFHLFFSPDIPIFHRLAICPLPSSVFFSLYIHAYELSLYLLIFAYIILIWLHTVQVPYFIFSYKEFNSSLSLGLFRVLPLPPPSFYCVLERHYFNGGERRLCNLLQLICSQ